MGRAWFTPQLVGLLACAHVARAQVRATADLGASYISQSGIPQSGAVTIGGALDALGDAGAFRSTGLATLAPRGRWTAQAVVGGAVSGPSTGFVRWGLDAAASAFGETGTGPTASGEALARAYFGSTPRGAAFGGGAGGTAHAGDGSPLYQAVGDGWWSFAMERLSLGASFTTTRAAFGDSSRFEQATGAISYGDLSAAWQHDAGAWTAGIGGGVRAQNTVVRSAKSWGSVDAQLWISPRVAIVATAGQSLADIVRGVPSARYATLALRVASGVHAAIGRHRVEPSGPRLMIESVDSVARRIDVRAPNARSVELMADFTDWAPVALERVGDTWRIERAIAPGLHRVAIRVDGGEWVAPVNLPHTTDEFGGVVALVTVP